MPSGGTTIHMHYNNNPFIDTNIDISDIEKVTGMGVSRSSSCCTGSSSASSSTSAATVVLASSSVDGNGDDDKFYLDEKSYPSESNYLNESNYHSGSNYLNEDADQRMETQREDVGQSLEERLNGVGRSVSHPPRPIMMADEENFDDDEDSITLVSDADKIGQVINSQVINSQLISSQVINGGNEQKVTPTKTPMIDPSTTRVLATNGRQQLLISSL